MKIIEVTDIEDTRIDKYLIEELSLSRSKVQKLINQESILVNNKKVKCSYNVKEEDIITIMDTDIEHDMDIKEENIYLDIVYEDDDIAIINKPSGMVVHPAVGNYSKTLVNALMYHFKNLSNKETIRPGIVHRIDKDTSGLLIVCKNDYSFSKISEQISNKTVVREYLALVHGLILNDTGTIDAPIGRDKNDRKKLTVTEFNSKDAITHFTVLKRFKEVTLIKCILETGRTHQIRVHMKYINHPIVNDPVYGHKKLIDENFGQMLHAYKIGFIHPTTNKYIEFTKDPDDKFYEILKLYEEGENDEK